MKIVASTYIYTDGEGTNRAGGVGTSCGSAARENVIKIRNSRGIPYTYAVRLPKPGLGGEGR